ncbi:GvpL/GvpF family gas vesicle protein [Nocardioides sp. TF02-7]|nr:GvpL/GvpF family gas vesicle protein [Nocardioides sp. TF02-7]
MHACAEAAPTAPMRLATICLDDPSVRRRLEEQYDALAAALDRVEGRAEWSVKVYAHPTPRGAEAAEPAVSSGAAYLRRKKAAATEKRAAAEQSAATAQEVDLALRELCVASRRLRPQDPRLSGVEGTMLLNGAYLVDARARDAFTQRVAELAAAHPEVSVACAGPWPPYSFATLEPV